MMTRWGGPEVRIQTQIWGIPKPILSHGVFPGGGGRWVNIFLGGPFGELPFTAA